MAIGILVVDGNPHTRSATERLLTAAGYQVTSTPAFEDAWWLMSRERPDLLLTVVGLGRFNGLDLAFRGRFDHPDLPIIVFAEPGEESLEKDVVQWGGRFVLTKRIGPQEILALVAELLQGGPNPPRSPRRESSP